MATTIAHLQIVIDVSCSRMSSIADDSRFRTSLEGKLGQAGRPIWSPTAETSQPVHNAQPPEALSRAGTKHSVRASCTEGRVPPTRNAQPATVSRMIAFTSLRAAAEFCVTVACGQQHSRAAAHAAKAFFLLFLLFLDWTTLHAREPQTKRADAWPDGNTV